MIRFGLYTPTIALSSDLPDITIFTDHDFVDFRLLAGGYALLEGLYYALNGSTVVSDISSIIEHFLAGNTDNNLFDFNLEAKAGGESATATFNVLYCDKSTGLFAPEYWLKENFLTLSPFRRLAPDSYINLSWYTTEKEGIMFRVYATFINDKGQRDTYFYAHSGNGMIAHINGIMSELVYLSDIRKKIISAKKIESLTLQSVSVRCGERSATFFIDPALAGIVPFFYLNCFGVVEQLSLQRTTTEKVKADRSIATLGKSSQFYDVTTSKEYEVESAALTSDECLQVDQMLTSPSVRIPYGPNTSLYDNDFDALIPILITDFTSELSDTDEKLNSVKFTWRFAENRPKIAAPQSPGIFNEKFNPTFS